MPWIISDADFEALKHFRNELKPGQLRRQLSVIVDYVDDVGYVEEWNEDWLPNSPKPISIWLAMPEESEHPEHRGEVKQ